MQEVVKTIRSIKQDYLHPKDRPDGKPYKYRKQQIFQTNSFAA